MTDLSELRELIVVAYGNQPLYHDLIDQYQDAVKAQDDIIDEVLIVTERKELLESRLPDVTDEEFDEYTGLIDMWGILWGES